MLTVDRPARTPRRVWRLVAVAVALGLLGLLGGTAASAAPVKDLDGLPVELQKYVPDSAAWTTSPWMTSASCKNKGGDFSAWVVSVIADTPRLLAYFQSSSYGPGAAPEGKDRFDAEMRGYQQLGTDILTRVPPGYCVDDMKRWSSPDRNMKPFGFPWGVTAGDGHQSLYYCTDRTGNPTRAQEYNRYFGAERAMCDAFYVSCANAPDVEKNRCETWNVFSDDYARRVDQLRGKAINDHPASGEADYRTVLKSPDQLAAEMTGEWFHDLTVNFSNGATGLLAEAMTFWTTTDRTSMLQSSTITEIQRLLRYIGLVLLVASVMWQGIVMMYKAKADPLVNVGMGLLSFVAWSTLGGTLAVMLNEAGIALSTQVLDASIDGFSEKMSVAMTAAIAINPAAVFCLALLLLLLSCVQWVLGFFRTGALVVLLALLPTAAAGQVNESTKPWLKKVLTWSLALLLYQPIAAIVFAIGFKAIGEGNDLSTVLMGLAILTLAVVSMPTMLKFFDWGGQAFTGGGSGGGGGAMAMGAAASALGGGGPMGLSRFMDKTGPGGGGGDGEESGAMPVTSAHGGDGPGGPQTGGSGSPQGSVGDGPSGADSGTGSTGSGGPPDGSGDVSSAVGTATTGSATGAQIGTAAGGGATAAAGPVGAAVGAAKEVGGAAVDAADGAMTEGTPQTGGQG